jgi:MYXO-CTERM domain-containing protein
MRCLALLLLLLWPATGRAVTYYLAKTGCSTTGPGSEAQPWCTFTAAFAALAPGDTLRLRDGIYNEQVVVTVSGTDGKPITIEAAAGAKPVIEGTALKIVEEGLIHVTGRRNLVLRGLTVRGSPFYCVQVSNSRDVTVEKMTVDGCTHGGIVFDQGSSLVKALDNEIANTGTCGIAGPDKCAQGCGIHEAITFSATTQFVAARNNVHDGSKEGIDAKDGSADGEIYDNVIANMCRVGIYLNHASWVRVYRNQVHDVKSTCVQLAVGDFALGPTETTKNRIYQNVIWSCRYDGIGFWKTVPGSMAGNAIYNNTVYNTGASGILLENSPGNVVANNILARCTGAGIIGNTLFNIPISYNLFWQTQATAGDRQVNADPLFVDAPKADFHLRGGSPAIDQGFDLGLQKVGAPDIGAFEYGLRPGETPSDSGGCSVGGQSPASSAAWPLGVLAMLLAGRRRRITRPLQVSVLHRL